MRILHYALGLPPYRTGGLTKYVVDLMREQTRQGHEVAILWPGRMCLAGKKISIRREMTEFENFELINPLPVPLLEGVVDIAAYTAKGDEEVFVRFLEEQKPDVIEIHTFMGLYKEFVGAAKKLEIPMVFVTHDYYTLCPKVNLLCRDGICETGMTDEACSRCNMLGAPLSIKKIYLMQSPLYRMLKDSRFLKMMRKGYKKKLSQDAPINTIGKSVAPESVAELHSDKEQVMSVLPYHVLQEYYLDMLNSMDRIHANSSLAAGIYRKFGCDRKITVLPISNSGIGDYRQARKAQEKEELHLLYLGPAGAYKGYFLLNEVLGELWQEGIRNYKLHVYGIAGENKPYIIFHEQFNQEQLKEVYGQADLTLVPSLWKETFGFVAAESLSYGTPVLVTEYVGAKDLVKDGRNGFCIPADKRSLKDKLEAYLTDDSMRETLQQGVSQEEAPCTMEQHVKELEELLIEVVQEKKEQKYND